MFNQVIFNGNLVDNVRESVNQQGKLTVFGKIGVYNGKNQDGTQRESMFFDIVVFGRDAEILRDNTQKGSPVVVIGRLEKDKTVSQTNGQTYVNERIVCTSAKPLLKPVTQQVQQPQYTQGYAAPQQAQYAQPAYDPFAQ